MTTPQGPVKNLYLQSLSSEDSSEIVGKESTRIRFRGILKKMSRKYRENIKGVVPRKMKFVLSTRLVGIHLALIDAAQGTKSPGIGLCLPIVLGRVPKRVYFALPRGRTRSKLESLLVIMVCGGVALALSFYFRERSVKPAAPAVFLLLIISVAHGWGRLASLFVALVGGLVFAAFLFEPYGSLAVCNAADRIVLLLFALSAIAAVCLSKNSDTRPK